ncbi:MAG TPA: hypothetical protein EYN71_11550, partial [Flavobacteriales bacterium]|nr:hypothetical protein [Flavobacteriales bacterium]
TLSGLADGTYTITIVSDANCNGSFSGSATITTEAAPDPGSNGIVSYCSTGPGGDLLNELGGTPDGGGVWTGPSVLVGADLGTFDPLVNAAGTYTYTVTGVAPCTDAVQTVTVAVSSLDDASFGYSASTFCVTGTDPDTTFAGTPGGTFSGSGSLVVDPNTGMIDLMASGTGTYDVYYATAGSCPDADTLSITITTSPSAEIFYGGPYCATGTAPVTFGIGASAGVFGNTAGLFLDSLTGEINLDSSIVGTYVVTNTIAAGGGCAAASDTATITINAIPNVTAIANPQTICLGDSSQMIGQGAATYTWDNGVVDGDYVIPLITTTYLVTGTDANNCENSGQVTITVMSPVIRSLDITMCSGDSIFLQGAYQFVASILVDTLTASNGCDSVIITNLTLSPNPVLEISDDATIDVGESLELVASGASSYLWSTGDTLDQITVSPLETTTYYVTGYNIFGCAAIVEVEVEVVYPFNIYVPNVFSPTSLYQDNKKLYVFGTGVEAMEFVIFDRWGEVVFRSDNIRETNRFDGLCCKYGYGWNGTYKNNGTELNSAVFTYLLKGRFTNGEEFFEKGNITKID